MSAAGMQNVQSSLSSGGSLRGSAFWYLTAQAPGDENRRYDYSMGFQDSTLTCALAVYVCNANTERKARPRF